MLLYLCGGGRAHWVQVVQGAGLPVSCGACSLLFVLSLAVPLVDCLQIWLCFAFLGGFDGVLWVSCGFVLVACFAWIVWLLCA